ncbi:MAG: endo-1,4-beta-xylanase, partial [Planctomycetes bacterium]|nr:endo-1,4-beta-xylanase [Planctomycetota bacterium]
LRANGVPIHGIGYQGHMFLDFPKLEEMESVLQSCAEAGIPLSITELDVSVLPNAWKHRGASVEDNFKLARKFNPYADGIPQEILQQQAKRYRDIFRLFLKYSDNIERVTFWGLWDGNSWRNYKPMEGRTDYPLLFDRNFQKKPAYHAIKIATRQKK